MKKNIFFIRIIALICLPFWGFTQQPEMYEGVFYMDDRCVTANCFTQQEKEIIQTEIGALKELGFTINILFISEECNPLHWVEISNGNGYTKYLDGPTDKHWGRFPDANCFTVLCSPGKVRYYYTDPSNVMNLDTLYPAGGLIAPYDRFYYCTIMGAIINIREAKGLPEIPPNTYPLGCNAVIFPDIVPNLEYLNATENESFSIIKRNSKKLYCSDIVFYNPYHIGAFSKNFNGVVNEVKKQTGSDFILIKLQPQNNESSATGNAYKYKSNIKVSVVKGGDGPALIVKNGVDTDQNCRPVSRDLTSDDENEIQIEMFGPNPVRDLPTLETLTSGVDFLLEKMLSTSQQPVPGGVSCNSQNSNAPPSSYSPTGNFKHLSAGHIHRYKIFSPTTTPKKYKEEKYNDFAGLSTAEFNAYAQMVDYASARGFDLKLITSAYKGNPAAYIAAKNKFDATQLSSNGGVLLLHWDEESSRMYYEVKFGSGVKNTIDLFQDKMYNAIGHFIESGNINDEKDQNPGINDNFVYPQGITPEDEKPWYFGVRSDKTENIWMNSLAELMATGKDIALEGELPSRLWHPDSTDCMFDSPGMITGTANGLIANVDVPIWNVTQLGGFAYDVVTDAELRESLRNVSAYQAVTLLFGDKIEAVEKLTGDEKNEVKMYYGSNLTVGVVTMVVTGSIVDGDALAEKLKDLFKRFDPTTYADFIEKAKATIASIYPLDRSKKISDPVEIGKQINELRAKFAEDIEKMDDLSKSDFINHPSWIDSWNKFATEGKIFLKRNVKILETLDEFSNGTITRQFQNFGLSEIDEAVIRHYTKGYSEKLNLALINVPGYQLTEEFIEFTSTLNAALDKLPNYEGLVYRGLGISESGIAKKWNIGETQSFEKFLSSSYSFATAYNFMESEAGDVVLQIQSKSGKKIEEVSKFHEKEVLFGTGKQFRVVSKDFSDGISTIVLEEI